MKKQIFKMTGMLIMFLSIFICMNSLEAAQNTAVSILVIYPQNTNAPKRTLNKKEKPAVLKGDVIINVTGINSEQLKSPDLYVEYFLDDELIYSTQDEKQDKIKKTSLGFILDTTKYENGNHRMVVNLWDAKGPSAIGIREITIQNETQNNEN